MTTHAIEGTIKQAAQKTQIVGSAGFDWAVIGVSSWLIAGFYADGWAHNHLPIDNFFTPWHGLLYSGLLSVMVFLIGTVVRNRLRGYSLFHAIPAGDEQSVLGMLVFFASGIVDMIWHTLFGIELNIDGALSPTHIGLIVSTTLIVPSPFQPT